MHDYIVETEAGSDAVEVVPSESMIVEIEEVTSSLRAESDVIEVMLTESIVTGVIEVVAETIEVVLTQSMIVNNLVNTDVIEIALDGPQGVRGLTGLSGPQGEPGPPGSSAGALLDEHVESSIPHSVYDEGPSLFLLYQNAKA